MSECVDRFESLTHPVETVLDEDLPALERLPERVRIERYNELKANEEELVWQFSEECPNFLTHSERARIRGRFRLARLLVAASLYSERGELPPAIADDFVEAELEAVVEFDRYRQFDALSDAQIEEKIRRMDGEVYELVTEYTSTQLATIESLLEHPEVQQDVMEQLLERYEQRREKIRRGFFTYVETHGLEHVVETIEATVEAVDSARTERGRVREQRDNASEPLSRERDGSVTSRQRLDAAMSRLERKLASDAVDTDQLQAELDELREQVKTLADREDSAVAELRTQIEHTRELDKRLEAKVEELQQTRERTVSEPSDQAGEKATRLVEDELERLRKEREQLQSERAAFERDREQIESVRDSLEEKRELLEEKQETLEQQSSRDNRTRQPAREGLEGSNAVTAETAKLLEMDYLGRFDISMHETDSIRMGEETFDVPDDYWAGRSHRRNDRGYLLSILEEGHPDQYPVNETSRYEITSAGVLGLGSRTEMVIEARVVSNLYAYATNGADTSPADLDTLLAHVNEVVAEAQEGEYTYLLGLASPTGWTARVREQIQDDEFSKTRYSRHVSVCLVSLQDGSLIYDESDATVRENAHLFAPPVDAERVRECVETVRTKYVEDIGHESVLLDEVVDTHGYDPQVVKRAFNTLEEEGAGDQLYLDELGLSLAVGT